MVARRVRRGSPPRTPGAQGRRDVSRGEDRITCRHHPRVRGEHAQVLQAEAVALGSPPRTRGAPRDRLAIDDGARITPAYAGSMRSANGLPDVARDHPRVRGEHSSSGSAAGTTSGSPPRAYAGSTRRPVTRSLAVQDHPRVRGEHARRASVPGLSVGSPPRTRGAPRSAPVAQDPARITPAYAGSTGWRK
mgnify:CR=1 FL=1